MDELRIYHVSIDDEHGYATGRTPEEAIRLVQEMLCDEPYPPPDSCTALDESRLDEEVGSDDGDPPTTFRAMLEEDRARGKGSYLCGSVW